MARRNPNAAVIGQRATMAPMTPDQLADYMHKRQIALTARVEAANPHSPYRPDSGYRGPVRNPEVAAAVQDILNAQAKSALVGQETGLRSAQVGAATELVPDVTAARRAALGLAGGAATRENQYGAETQAQRVAAGKAKYRANEEQSVYEQGYYPRRTTFETNVLPSATNAEIAGNEAEAATALPAAQAEVQGELGRADYLKGLAAQARGVGQGAANPNPVPAAQANLINAQTQHVNAQTQQIGHIGLAETEAARQTRAQGLLNQASLWPEGSPERRRLMAQMNAVVTGQPQKYQARPPSYNPFGNGWENVIPRVFNLMSLYPAAPGGPIETIQPPAFGPPAVDVNTDVATWPPDKIKAAIAQLQAMLGGR